MVQWLWPPRPDERVGGGINTVTDSRYSAAGPNHHTYRAIDRVDTADYRALYTELPGVVYYAIDL